MGKGTICHKYWYKWREAEGQVCTAQELTFHNGSEVIMCSQRSE